MSANVGLAFLHLLLLLLHVTSPVRCASCHEVNPVPALWWFQVDRSYFGVQRTSANFSTARCLCLQQPGWTRLAVLRSDVLYARVVGNLSLAYGDSQFWLLAARTSYGFVWDDGCLLLASDSRWLDNEPSEMTDALVLKVVSNARGLKTALQNDTIYSPLCESASYPLSRPSAGETNITWLIFTASNATHSYKQIFGFSHVTAPYNRASDVCHSYGPEYWVATLEDGTMFDLVTQYITSQNTVGERFWVNVTRIMSLQASEQNPHVWGSSEVSVNMSWWSQPPTPDDKYAFLEVGAGQAAVTLLSGIRTPEPSPLPFFLCQKAASKTEFEDAAFKPACLPSTTQQPKTTAPLAVATMTTSQHDPATDTLENLLQTTNNNFTKETTTKSAQISTDAATPEPETTSASFVTTSDVLAMSTAKISTILTSAPPEPFWTDATLEPAKMPESSEPLSTTIPSATLVTSTASVVISSEASKTTTTENSPAAATTSSVIVSSEDSRTITTEHSPAAAGTTSSDAVPLEDSTTKTTENLPAAKSTSSASTKFMLYFATETTTRPATTPTTMTSFNKESTVAEAPSLASTVPMTSFYDVTKTVYQQTTNLTTLASYSAGSNMSSTSEVSKSVSSSPQSMTTSSGDVTVSFTTAVTTSVFRDAWQSSCQCIHARDTFGLSADRKSHIAGLMKLLKKGLTLDVNSLSARKRRKSSAPDFRPSAIALGSLGTLVIILVVAAIVVPDVTSIMALQIHRITLRLRSQSS